PSEVRSTADLTGNRPDAPFWPNPDLGRRLLLRRYCDQSGRRAQSAQGLRKSLAVCGLIVTRRNECLHRVGQLFDVFAFVPAALPVVGNITKYPLRGISRGFVTQKRFPVFNGPKHHSPLCFVARVIRPLSIKQRRSRADAPRANQGA